MCVCVRVCACVCVCKKQNKVERVVDKDSREVKEKMKGVWRQTPHQKDATQFL